MFCLPAPVLQHTLNQAQQHWGSGRLAQAAKLYHMGLRYAIKRSTLADANESRDWRIYATFAQRLIAQAVAVLKQDQVLGLERAGRDGAGAGKGMADRGGGQDFIVTRRGQGYSIP